MNSKNIIAGLITAISLSANAQGEPQDTTVDAIAAIQNNIAFILREPCSGMEGVKLLNCRLRTPNITDAGESDAIIRKKVSEGKNTLNFFLANGLGLPVSVVTQSSELASPIPGVPVVEKQTLKFNFLPVNLQATFGVERFSVKYDIPF